MKLRYEPGELYFLQERDLLTEELSNNIKIGLVRGERDSLTRLMEHQTGNSRGLSLYRTTKSKSVNALETAVHQLFSGARLHGEWFVLPETDLDQAISFVNDLAANIDRVAELGLEAQSFESRPSNSKVVEPSKGQEELHQKLIESRNRLAILIHEQSRLKADIGDKMQNYAGIKGVAKWNFSERKGAFSKAKLKNLDPVLYENNLVPSEVASGRLSLSGLAKGHSAPKLKYPRNIEQLMDDLEYRKRSLKIEKMHGDFIMKNREIMTEELIGAELSIKMKLEIKEAEAIRGLASWKRVIGSKPRSNLAEIVEGFDTDLFRRCFTETKKIDSLEVFDYRPYKPVNGELGLDFDSIRLPI